MAALPGGTYLVGDRRDTVTVRPFAMDLTEVTVDSYAACVQAGHCTDDHVDEWSLGGETKPDSACNYGVPGKGRHPMNCVDYKQADAYCRSQHKRLPTEEEWEWAARGEDEGRLFPWGNGEPGSRICWSGPFKRKGTCPVGSTPEGDARFKIHDLAGNVAEWTSTRFSQASDARVCRGGGFTYSNPDDVRAATRHRHAPTERVDRLGFRCAR
jgi:formylglycine-generating enzyme